MSKPRKVVGKVIAVLVITAIAGGAAYLFGGSRRKGVVNVGAVVSLSATVNPDSTVQFDETFQIDTSNLKNGRGRRYLFTPAGTSFRFVGVDDITTGAPEKVNAAGWIDIGEKHEITWMFPPKTGIRTFVVKYAITGAVRHYAGGGQVFSWTFWDKSNPLNIESFSAALNLPSGAAPGQYAFARDSAQFEDLSPSGTQVSWDAGKVAAKSVAEMTVEFSTPALGQAPGTTSYQGTATDAARDMHKEWASRATKQRIFDVLRVGVPLLLGLALMLIALYLFWRYGREYKMANPPLYEREPPTAETPAEVNWLDKFGTIELVSLTGTIIDLARRRHLKVEEPPDRSENVILVATPDKPRQKTVAAHESRTLEWLFPDGTGTVDFDARAESLKQNQGSWTAFWASFTEDVDGLGDSKNLIERRAGSGRAGCLITLGFTAVVASIVAGALLGFAWVLVAFGGAVMLVTAPGLSKRSYFGNEVWMRWDAFRRYMHDFGNLNDVPPVGVVVWEDFLPYAIVLGEGETVIEYMKLRPPAEGADDWYPANPAVFLLMSSGVGGWQTAGTPASSGSSSGGSSFGGGGGGGFGGGGGASFD